MGKQKISDKYVRNKPIRSQRDKHLILCGGDTEEKYIKYYIEY